ncbi:hypothetical protein CsatB_015887 [Cannabis sativa]
MIFLLLILVTVVVVLRFCGVMVVMLICFAILVTMYMLRLFSWNKVFGVSLAFMGA